MVYAWPRGAGRALMLANAHAAMCAQVLAGSVVAQGEAEAVVTATGGATFFGKTVALLSEPEEVGHLRKVWLASPILPCALSCLWRHVRASAPCLLQVPVHLEQMPLRNCSQASSMQALASSKGAATCMDFSDMKWIVPVLLRNGFQGISVSRS